MACVKAAEASSPSCFDPAVKITHRSYVIFVKELKMRTDEFQSFTSTESCNIRVLPGGSEGEQVRSQRRLCFLHLRILSYRALTLIRVCYKL